MSNKIQINRVTNANIYVDGKSLLGRAEEISLPDVKSTQSEHKAIGMVGKMEFFSGLDKLEAKIKWNSFYSEVLKKAANPFQAVQLQARASLEVYTSAGRTEEVPVVIHMTGTFKNLPLGNFKQHDNVELETTLGITYYKLEINGEEISEVDVMANIFKAGGVDLMANYRANIGQ